MNSFEQMLKNLPSHFYTKQKGQGTLPYLPFSIFYDKD